MTTILTEPATLGQTVIDGQVLVLDVETLQVSAPNTKRDWFRLEIRAALPTEGLTESLDDVRWLFGSDARLYVVLSVREGTYDVDEIRDDGLLVTIQELVP